MTTRKPTDGPVPNAKPVEGVTPVTPTLDRLFDISNTAEVSEADLVAEIPAASFGSVLLRVNALTKKVEGVTGSVRKAIALRCNLDLGFCWGLEPEVLSEADRGLQVEMDKVVKAALAEAIPGDGAQRAALSRMRAESCEVVRAYMAHMATPDSPATPLPEIAKVPAMAASLAACASDVGDADSKSWASLIKRAEASGAGVQRKEAEAKRVASAELSPEAKAAAVAEEAAKTPEAKFVLLMKRADEMLDKMKKADPASNIIRSDIVDIGNVLARHIPPKA